MFVRKASGLVRAWSVFDGFLYAMYAVNIITLGFYIFASAPSVPNAHLVPAIIVSSVFVVFECVVYAMLVSVMPRAGGDYVWQSRILGSGLGFVMTITGWVFILWVWAPIDGVMLSYLFITPLLTILGGWLGNSSLINVGLWFSGNNGMFINTIFVIILDWFVISAGMKFYARMQKATFFIGAFGLLLMAVYLLVGNQASFIAGFNHYATTFLGTPGSNPYQAIMAMASKGGYTPVAWNNMSFTSCFALIPIVLFWNLWPNWGCTLYGEVQGASDFRRNFWSMAGGLLFMAVVAIIFLALFAKTLGWGFYHDINWAFYSGQSPFPVFPAPGLLVAFLSKNPIMQLLLLVTMSAWFFGWCISLFLSSSRVVFAAAFDRVLPEWISTVNPKTRAPNNALLCMCVPAVIVSILYFYLPHFSNLVLDGTVGIAITYLGTTIAAIILPYKEKSLFESSPVGRYKIFGIPWIVVAGVIFGGFLVWNIYMWITRSVYGVNSVTSAIFMAALYILAIVIYLVSKAMRRKQGIDLDMVYKNIPVE
jgi:amino acid transporter